jgi:hypothetical protein
MLRGNIKSIPFSRETGIENLMERYSSVKKIPRLIRNLIIHTDVIQMTAFKFKSFFPQNGISRYYHRTL